MGEELRLQHTITIKWMRCTIYGTIFSQSLHANRIIETSINKGCIASPLRILPLSWARRIVRVIFENYKRVIVEGRSYFRVLCSAWVIFSGNIPRWRIARSPALLLQLLKLLTGVIVAHIVALACLNAREAAYRNYNGESQSVTPLAMKYS